MLEERELVNKIDACPAAAADVVPALSGYDRSSLWKLDPEFGGVRALPSTFELGGNIDMNSRAFQNSEFGSPSLSTSVVFRDPNPITTLSWNMQSVQDSAIANHDIPDSRLFAVTPGRWRFQLSMIHSTHSTCRGNSINGITVGRPTSTLRGSIVHDQSEMNCAG